MPTILTSEYIDRVSENAFLILYWSARFRCNAEEKIEDPQKVRAVLEARIPEGVKLAGADLQEVDLELIILESADLSRADLTKANLFQARFKRVVLQASILTSANAIEIEAIGINAREADLTDTAFSSARIFGCDLTGAVFDPSQFAKAEICDVKGLHSVAKSEQELLEPVVQLGSGGVVYAVAYSQTADLLAIGSQDGVIYLLRAHDGRLLRTLQGHSSYVWSVAFDPRGKTIASGSHDKTVKVWQSDTGTLPQTLQGHSSSVLSVAFDPRGKTIASGGDDNTVEVWRSDTGRLLNTLQGHSYSVRSVAFDPQGHRIASGSYDKTVKLWEVDSGKLVCTLEGHLGAVESVQFSPSGRYLVAAGSAGRLQFWDIDTEETFLYLYAFGPGSYLSLLPDGRFDGTPDALRYLCYTEHGTFNSFTAEELIKEFHDPKAVKGVLAKYHTPR